MEENKVVDFLKSPVGRIVLIAVLYIVMFGVEYLLVSIFAGASTVVCIIAVVLAYFGWQALSMITPNMFLIMPLSSWLWYWTIKGALSVVLGIFVAPYQIAKMIVNKI